MLHVSDWTAGVEIALVDQPNSKRVVARIHEGEKAQAVTGEGHSIPLRVLAKHDHPDAGVKAATSFIACTTPARRLGRCGITTRLWRSRISQTKDRILATPGG